VIQVRTAQVGAAEVGVLQVRLGKHGPRPNGTGQDCAGEPPKGTGRRHPGLIGCQHQACGRRVTPRSAGEKFVEATEELRFLGQLGAYALD